MQNTTFIRSLFISFMTLVYCGSLVRALQQASKSVSRVRIMFHVAASDHFLAEVHASTVSQPPTPSECPLHEQKRSRRSRIGAVGNNLVVLLVGYALQADTYAFLTRRLLLCAKAQHVLSHEPVLAGRVFVEGQVPHQISGQRLPVKEAPSSSTLQWDSWSGHFRV